MDDNDYYLNKAYSGVTVVNKLPLPDYLLEGYGNIAADYGVRMMVGKDYIWEIDKPNRQIKYARSVIESGWVGSREDSTVNGSEATIVATKGSNGKLFRASIKDPKVKIETISSQLLKGLGKEVLDYAIPLIDPEAKDWVLDPDSNRVQYKDPDYVDGAVTGEKYYEGYTGKKYSSVSEACEATMIQWSIEQKKQFTNARLGEVNYLGRTPCYVTSPDGDEVLLHNIKAFDNPAYDPNAPSDEYKYIPIDTVSQQVNSNADSGHLESQTFLKSIPLFAYLLTGSGTEAVNKAVLDIEPEATDWVLDPANNSVRYAEDVDVPYDDPSNQYIYSLNINHGGASTPQAVCDYWNANDLIGTWTGDYFYKEGGAYGICSAPNYPSGWIIHQFTNPNYNPDAPNTPKEKTIPINTVAAKVIANADSGHAPSQEALRLSTVERVDIGEYDEALEAVSIEIDTSWKYLPIYDVAVQVKRNSIAGHAESIEAVNNSLPFELPNYEPNITITGIAKVGEILTATVTDENGVPSSINYQWYADGEVILGATAETYVLKESEAGKSITVKAEFTDKDGFSESVSDTVDVEVVDTGDMGLRADYSGSGWYKATDTGTVFNKGVPEGETHVFSDSPKEYVSVYTKADVKLYGERAAVSNIISMRSMFHTATSFNSDISSWDVSSITDMNNMFYKSSSFNQDISSWDVSKVTDMSSMFDNSSSFNQDISSWDVSSVTDMDYLFNGATSFNQDLSKWCVSLIPTEPSNFETSATAWTLPKPVWGTCPRGEDLL